MKLLSFFILSLIISITFAAWDNGHYGVDRPGFDLELLEDYTTEVECSLACRSHDECQAWTYYPSTCVPPDPKPADYRPYGLRSDGRENLCLLKSEVPDLVLAEGANCAVSGVKAANLLPLQNFPTQLGTIAPLGWLSRQLVIQANGLGGHLSLFWADVNQSVWVGGKSDVSGAGHERVPYWLNGMVPLLAHLKAGNLLNQVTVDLQGLLKYFIDYILNHQLANGWLGPDDGFGGTGNTYWTAWDVTLALMQWAQFNPDYETKATTAVFKYIQESHRRMVQTPMESWSQNRWSDWTWTCQMMIDYNWTFNQEQLLWDAGALAQQQGFSWNNYYNRVGQHQFPEQAVPAWTLYDHGVNNAMALKGGAIWYRQSNQQSDAQQSTLRLNMLTKYHGLSSGIFSADECFAGRNPSRGTELCTVVEYIESLNWIYSVQGGITFADAAERATYNALPAEITPDMWAHQYLQQNNEINAQHTDPHVWASDGPDSTIFGLEPNFGCCTANFVQGWPKMVSNTILVNQNQGIMISQYAPVRATLPSNIGGGATVEIDTDYPFGDNATIKATVKSGSVPLHFRVPAWADGSTYTLNGGAAQALKPGTVQTVTATGTTTVFIDFKPQIKVETGWGYDNSVAVVRGPLVYALYMNQQFNVIRSYQFQSKDYSVSTTSTWNFALVVDPNNPGKTLTFERLSGPLSIPYSHQTTSGQVIHAKGRAIPAWKVQTGAAAQPPTSPITCSGSNCGEVVDLVLVPFGSTNLRIGSFPWTQN